MASTGVSKLMAMLLLLHYPGHSLAFGWWFLWSLTAATTVTQSTSSSNTTASPIVSETANGLQISLGNRENSSTAGTDGGTDISNVEVNYARILSPPAEYAQFFSSFQQGETGDESRSIPFGAYAPAEWIDTILVTYIRTANDTRRHKLSAFDEQFIELESYAEDVAAMLNRIRIAFGIELNQKLLTLDVEVLRCAQRQAALDTIAGQVFAGDRDCITGRLALVANAQLEAARNISRELLEWDEDYLRNEISLCSEGDGAVRNETSGSDSWTYDEHELACISGILHQVHLKTLLMSHTAQQLTEEATDIFGTAKADLLQCAGDLVELARDSLRDINKITSDCQKHRSGQHNKVK